MEIAMSAAARFLLLCLGLAAGMPSLAMAQDLKGEALFAALKQGGYVIYLRHAASDATQNDLDPVDFANCASQRNLSEDGRVQAKAIGKAMAALGIAADKVLASPYCRTKETAALAFGTVETAEPLRYSDAMPENAQAALIEQLKRMLGIIPTAGKNTVMVGHSSNMKAAAGTWPRTEGGAVVLQPKSDGGFAIVGAFSAAEVIKAGG
jgi:phosphohistidine phosphatase SixA